MDKNILHKVLTFFSFSKSLRIVFILLLLILQAQTPVEKQIDKINKDAAQAIDEGNYEKAIKLADFALRIADSLNVDAFQAESYILLAEANSKYIQTKGINADSILVDSVFKPTVENYVFGRLEVEKKTNLAEKEKQELFDIYMEIGDFYDQWQAPNLALEYFEKAREQNISNPKNKETNLFKIAKTYQNLAVVYQNQPQEKQNNLRSALNNYQKIDALQKRENSFRASERLPVLNELASLYTKLGDYSAAIDANMEMIPLLDSDTDKAALFNNIGYLYQKELQNDSANIYFQKSLEKSKKIPKSSEIYFNNLINLSELNRKNENYALALSYLDTLQKNTIEDSLKIAEIHNYKASVYYSMNDYERAKKESEKAIKISEEKGYYMPQVIANKRISEIYEKWLNNSKSDEYRRKAQAIEKNYLEEINDEINQKRRNIQENEKMFAALENLAEEKSRREDELERLKNEKVLREKEAENARLEKENAENELRLEKERAERERREREQERQAQERKQKEIERQVELDKLESEKKLAEREKEAAKEREKRAEFEKEVAEKNQRLKEMEAQEAQEDADAAKAQSRRLLWIIIIGIIFVLLILIGLIRIREANKKLAKQQKEIQEKNKELVEQKTEIQEKNEELHQQQEEIIVQNERLEEQATELKEKSKHITESIQYAERIQSAMLPHLTNINNALPLSFIFFRPRDIVSGDFYWFMETLPEPTFGLLSTPEGRMSVLTGFTGAKKIITAVDCTGHGVPGAFMSMIGNELLHNIVGARGIYQADKILNELHIGVNKALKQDETDNRDGMDMALCVVDEERKVVEFAGAKNPLIYVRDGELTEVKSDKMPIGGEQLEKERLFTKHEIPIDKPTTFYIFSDGYQDQFGGPNNRKFMRRRLYNLFQESYAIPAHEQTERLETALNDWKGDEKQIDDILIIGFRII